MIIIGLIIGFIIVFIVGVFIGICIMCFMKTAKEADLQIILLNIMDQLKKEKAAIEKENINTNTIQTKNKLIK